jgi:hypothetical protein
MVTADMGDRYVVFIFCIGCRREDVRVAQDNNAKRRNAVGSYDTCDFSQDKYLSLVSCGVNDTQSASIISFS